MRLGNILAVIGIISGTIGLICLPLHNLRELPYLADPSYPKSGWVLIVQSGIFLKPGIILLVSGIALFIFAKVLPKKYWKTTEDILDDEIKKGFKKKS